MMTLMLYLLLGACAGTLAGLFGVGGGMIIVPILAYSFRYLDGFPPSIAMHMAVSTSLAIIAFTSVNAVRAHHKEGAVQWSLLTWMALGILLGAVIGGRISTALPESALRLCIGIFALCVAAQMYFGLYPKGKVEDVFVMPSRRWQLIAGSVIGGASALFGIGGGSVTVPLLTWQRLPMHRAVATSAACGIPVAVFGALSYVVFGWHNAALPAYSLGYVYLPAVVGVALTSMVFARVGVRLAHRLSVKRLKQWFALLQVGVGLSFLFG